MTTSHALLAFLLASVLLTITPGLDTALMLRAAAGGEKRAVAAGVGICLGLLTWGFCASIGLGALLAASQLAYNVLRIAGACYLVYLGCRMFFRRGHGLAATEPVREENSGAAEDVRPWFARGLFSNLLNPKVGVFYVTFLPLFIPAGVSVVGFSLLLAGIHVLEAILWFALLIAAVRPLSLWLRRERVATTMDRVTGTVFVGFGLRLLFDRSR
jgi:threonine/homoserine/homoserine lactone efflux protein